MHGREGELWLHRRHMWPVPASSTSSVAVSTNSLPISPDSFSKDGRRIHVGDCALFKPLQDCPPFVGIIRRLIVGKEDNLSLCVNWLYRPADVKLVKGILLEAAPNEVFYSFHKDEIPAASLLHPCKVAFLRKGVELPPGISSFVCRRVYDIENFRLWWLTDQDYINSCLTQERQEEVDQLLDKTRIEMYGALQSGGRSPKPLNGPNGTAQLKPGSDSVQNSSSSFPSQVKGKKREQGVHGPDSVKRERLSRADDADSGQLKPEQVLKSEIAKITDKGGLVDFEGVEKLVQLMQPDSAEKKIDLACRIMLVDVISVTDRFDCLGRFVQLRGLPVLDEWLQEVHKGKIGDGSPKESDKSVEEFLFALLRALDRLPVNLHALQTCNVGKSVNHLRTHKNSEIQKKARTLVDTWKKRVEAEMNMIDAKSGSSRGGSWPTKSVISEVSHVGGRRVGGSSEAGAKSSTLQPSASTTQQAGAKSSGESVAKFSLASPGSRKLSALSNTAGVASTKDSVNLVGAASSDLPLSTIKEEKSSSSSQSQNNSQSCSSDHGKTGASGREDARSSTAGSVSVNKISSGVSRSRKSSNGLHGSVVSGVQKEVSFGKFSSLNRNLASEKGSPTRVTSERVADVPLVDNGSSQRLIVRLPNTGRSPARSASGGSPEDASASFGKGSPMAHSEKHDHHDRKVRGKIDAPRGNGAANINLDSSQGKDGLVGSDGVHVSTVGVLCDERGRDSEIGERLTDASKATMSASGITLKAGKSYEASFSSINALVESCAKFSEASVSASVGDDIGMNLLASVAAGEMSRSDASPINSPETKSPLPEDSCSGNDIKLRQADEDVARSEDQPNVINGDAMVEQGSVADSLRAKGGLDRQAMPMVTNFSGDSKVTSFGCEEKTGECSAQVDSSSVDLLQNGSGAPMASDMKPPGLLQDASAPVSSLDTSGYKEGGEGNEQNHERRKSVATRTRSYNVSSSKLKARSLSPEEDKNAGCVDAKSMENNAVVPNVAKQSAKVELQGNDESASWSSSEMHEDDKKMVFKQSSSSVVVQKAAHIVRGKSEDAPLATVGSDVGLDPKTEKAEDMNVGIHTEQSEKRNMDSCSSVLEHNGERVRRNPEKMEVLSHHTGGTAPVDNSPASLVQGARQCVKSSAGVEADPAQEPASRVNPSLVSTSGSDTAVKLDFDLNEVLPADDGSQGELDKSLVPGNSSSVHMPCPLPVSVSSMSGSLPASITVAAAAKGPFLPSESLLRSKVELGWKGSAATSAFRPAEPRKVVDAPATTVDAPVPENPTSKQARPFLDFDLNVGVVEDAVSQNTVPLTCSEPGPSDRSGGGLNLDLNTCDESLEMGQLSVSNGSKSVIPQLPPMTLLSGGFSKCEPSTSRDFDLNNGPGPDEVGSESIPLTKNGLPFLSPVSSVRMNNMELGNFSSWFSPGNTYSAIPVPPILPGRGEQSYPIVPAASSQRILAPAAASTSFGPEIFRGPVLSSSPAVAFPSTSPFQYSGFPFETNFPLPSNSFSGVSTAYVESSSGGPICFPPIPSQLVGPSGVVSTPYRPYVMSLPGGASSLGPDSRKWGSQGLDLNAGPGGTDIERREERMPSALRQLPLAGSQALAEEQLKMFQQMAGGGVLKRKEPDGGWDGDRLSYKHPSWQ